MLYIYLSCNIPDGELGEDDGSTTLSNPVKLVIQNIPFSIDHLLVLVNVVKTNLIQTMKDNLSFCEHMYLSVLRILFILIRIRIRFMEKRIRTLHRIRPKIENTNFLYNFISADHANYDYFNRLDTVTNDLF